MTELVLERVRKLRVLLDEADDMLRTQEHPSVEECGIAWVHVDAALDILDEWERDLL